MISAAWLYAPARVDADCDAFFMLLTYSSEAKASLLRTSEVFL